jgi:hypothetical protein
VFAPETMTMRVEDLIGKTLEDSVTQAFTQAHLPQPEVIDDDDSAIVLLSTVGGVELRAARRSRRIVGVSLYGNGHEGYGSFTGSLPHGLRFDMTKAQVLAQLGAPRTDDEDGLVYDLGPYSLSVELIDDDRVGLVTLYT